MALDFAIRARREGARPHPAPWLVSFPRVGSQSLGLLFLFLFRMHGDVWGWRVDRRGGGGKDLDVNWGFGCWLGWEAGSEKREARGKREVGERWKVRPRK